MTQYKKKVTNEHISIANSIWSLIWEERLIKKAMDLVYHNSSLSKLATIKISSKPLLSILDLLLFFNSDVDNYLFFMKMSLTT